MLIVIPGIPLDVYSCKNTIFARKTFIILRFIASKHYNRGLIKDSGKGVRGQGKRCTFTLTCT